MAEETQTFTPADLNIGGAAATSPSGGAATASPAVAPARPAGPDRAGFYWGTGRRKTAVARVRLKPGGGKIRINGRAVEKFFTELRDQGDVEAPLKLTKTHGALDVFVNVHGGGFSGQAGAVKLGISRALKAYDQNLEQALRDNDMLTRDDREVERKKYGQAGARKRFQFSKR